MIAFVDLEVYCEESDRGWVIEFRDQGAGFLPQDRKRIFRRFVRGRGVKRKTGSGLGLYLAKQASRQMGMRLTANSEGVNRGAQFRLEGKWHD